jgi:hypothetical protein
MDTIDETGSIVGDYAAEKGFQKKKEKNPEKKTAPKSQVKADSLSLSLVSLSLCTADDKRDKNW